MSLLHSNILGNGEPLVILHGFLGMSDNWKTLGRKFSEEGFEVHLIDQRNHGRSFHDASFSYEVMSEDLGYYCDHLGLNNIKIIGHSMGGKTAMFFATSHPEKVSKLVVADIAPRYYPVHHDTILTGLSAFDFNKLKSRGEADKALAQYVPEFGVRQFLLKNLYWVEKGMLGLRINLNVLKEEVAEVGEALPNQLKFEKDTLFLRGDRSEYISTADESLIKMQFPKAQIKTISNAGHWLHAENPQEFYHEVLNFIS